jgi:hypothetical protein
MTPPVTPEHEVRGPSAAPPVARAGSGRLATSLPPPPPPTPPGYHLLPPVPHMSWEIMEVIDLTGDD